MKLPMIASAVVFAFVAEGAVAACAAPGASQVKNIDLDTLLSGNTVCATRGGESWQEEHHSSGQLWDYKLGDGHPVDPRKQLGSWTITGNGSGANTAVQYSYSDGGTYTYEVWLNTDGSYSFCDAGTVNLDATVRPGINTGCGVTPG